MFPVEEVRGKAWKPDYLPEWQGCGGRGLARACRAFVGGSTVFSGHRESWEVKCEPETDLFPSGG